MSVVEGAVDFPEKKSLSCHDQGRCSGRTRFVLLFVGGVLLAAALTAAVAVVTFILYKKSPQEDGFVSYDYLSTPHAASVGVIDYQDKTGANGHQELYINDVTREHTIHIRHQYYDIFVLKKFNESSRVWKEYHGSKCNKKPPDLLYGRYKFHLDNGVTAAEWHRLLNIGREMVIVTTKPTETKPRRVLECDETNMTNTEFVASSVLLNEPISNPVEVKIEEKFQETSQPIKLAYKSCDHIPPALFKDQECSKPDATVSEVLRLKRRAGGKYGKNTKYGNWGGAWNKRWVFPRCCDGCKDRKRCSSMTCKPPLDSLDMAAMDYTYCTSCWKQTPTEDFPHCDCVKDLMNDLDNLRCPDDNYGQCYFYRSSLRGIMSNHKCWGRLVTKYIYVFPCGYKQKNCRKGKCEVGTYYCMRAKQFVKSNFQCTNFRTCEESTRMFSGQPTVVRNLKQ